MVFFFVKGFILGYLLFEED